MKPKKLNLLLAVFVVCMFIFSTIGIQLSTHSSCKAFSTQNHYYAFGYIDWFIQRRWIGGKVTFANPDPDYSTPNSSANQTIWVTTNNSADSWVETGYAKGWVINNVLDQNRRMLYTGRTLPSGAYADYAVTSVPVGPPGASHSYKIVYSNGLWRVYIDGVYVAYSNQLPYAKEIDVGLESIDLSNQCFKVYPYDMGYYYENQGWYSFGQAHPKTYTTNRNYFFQYTNVYKDSGVDWNYWEQ